MVYWLSLDVVEQRAEEEERETASRAEERRRRKRNEKKRKDKSSSERGRERKEGREERGKREIGAKQENTKERDEKIRRSVVTIDHSVGLFMGVPMRTICSKRLVVLNVYISRVPPVCIDQLARRNRLP